MERAVKRLVAADRRGGSTVHAVVETHPTFENAQKMRILTLSSLGGDRCGIGDYNAALSTALRARGHQVDVLELARYGDRAPMLQEVQRRIGKYDAAILQYDGSLYGDTFAEMYGNFAGVARLLGRRPAITILHEELSGQFLPPIPLQSLIKPWQPTFLPMWRELLARRSLNYARRTMIDAMNNGMTMLVHGEPQRQPWMKAGIASKKIKAVMYPLQPGAPLVEPRPLGNSDIVELTMFGNVAEYKGYEVALNAMRVLPDNYILTIAGDRQAGQWYDRTLDAIHRFIEIGRWPPGRYPAVASTSRPYSDAERQSMQARIRLVGHVPTKQIADLMNRTDINLVPYRKTFGSAVLADTIEFARPAIVTALPAFQYVAERTKCFRMVTPDAPFELAHAIRTLALDLNERRRMFEAAQTAARRYTFATLAEYCESIFVDAFSTQHALR
jgi:glycosyltransferase involved in cell wall biosynthesis